MSKDVGREAFNDVITDLTPFGCDPFWLLESSSVVFKNVFDRKLFEQWINDILDGNFPDVAKLRWKHDIKRLAIGFIGRSNYLKGSMKSFMVKNGMNTFPVINVNYLFRLVVLALALQQYENN